MTSIETVTTILSVGTVLVPILFGYILFRMTSYFVTKQQFEDYKILAQTERQFAHESLVRIESKLEKKG